MDLVPHIPHLHGLDIKFLRMHIDQEPPTGPGYPFHPNGHFGTPPVEDPRGFVNGYGFPR